MTQLRKKTLEELERRNYSQATARTHRCYGVTEQTALALSMIRVRKAIPVLMSRMSSASTQTECWLLDGIGRLGSDAEISYVAQYLYGAADDQLAGIAIADCAARSLDALTDGEIGLPPPGRVHNPSTTVRKAREWWEATGKSRFGK